MKVAALCILPLLYTLLSAQTNQTSSEQNEDLKRVTESIAGILPHDEKTQCQMKTAQWNEEKKNNAARNVFDTLKKLIKHPLELSFDKLIVGSKCNITGGRGAILHMKIKPNVTCKENFLKTCDENNQMGVYCSWIGILEKGKHKKMIGAVCYMSKTMLQFHRLEIPRQVSSKATDFLLYYPPATDLEYHSIVDEMGPEFSKVYVNQEGRTGLIGRGIWISLGENRMDIPILLRRYNGTRQILVATGQDKGQLKGPLAMFYRKPKTSELLKIWNETDANDYFYSMVEPGNRGTCTREKFDKDMKGKRKLFNSYLSHPYETDNAWVKARVYILTVSENSCLYNLNLKSPSNYLHYEWKSFNDSTLQTAENLVNSMFNKVESKTIIAGNRLSAAKYLAIFITAAIIISIVFFSTASALIIGLPVALIGLAGAIGAAYHRRWIHIHDYIHTC